MVALPNYIFEVLSHQRSQRKTTRGKATGGDLCFSSLKRIFGLGETLASTLVGVVTRIAAKKTAYTYAFLINRMLGRPQGRIKDLWA
jgi:hypothetical protein